MALKVPSPSTIIIAILFAVCGSSFALSDNCSTTRQLTKGIFGHSYEVHNKSVTGLYIFKILLVERAFDLLIVRIFDENIA